MKISIPGGPVIYDDFIPEPAAAPAETESTFAGGPAPVFPPPIPLATALVAPGTSVVVLTEPVGTVPDPGEVPIVIPRPNGDIVVSDMIISTLPATAKDLGILGDQRTFSDVLGDGSIAATDDFDDFSTIVD